MEKLMDLYNVRDFLVYYTACLFKRKCANYNDLRELDNLTFGVHLSGGCG